MAGHLDLLDPRVEADTMLTHDRPAVQDTVPISLPLRRNALPPVDRHLARLAAPPLG